MRMSKTLAFALICWMSCVFGNRIPTIGDDVKVTDAINSFGIELYKELSKSHDNIVCSGYSIATALNMLLVGARSNTEKEIRDVMGYTSAGIPKVRVEESVHRILKQQRGNQNGYQLDVANSMWIHEDFEVLPEFKSKIKDLFFAKEEEVDFKSLLATDRINDWVKQETHGKIEKLFDEQLDATTKMVLVNAMFFKGTWLTKFNEDMTTNRAFRYGSNDRLHVPTMMLFSKFPYHESRDLNAQVLELPYDGDDVSMVIVLPKEDTGLKTLHHQLDLTKLKSAVDQLEMEKVTVFLPKFKSSSTLTLNEVLKSLGIKEAFGSKADLSGIDGHQDLYVSNAIQKAVIEVSEEGTVAAAASGLEIQTKMMPINPPREFFFIADHPFLYFIRHKPTGLLLFMGSKTRP